MNRLQSNGKTVKSCDAGSPVMGVTDATGVYQFLKLKPDGSLYSSIAQGESITQQVLPAGPMATNTLLAFGQIVTAKPYARTLRLSPWVAFDTGGLAAGVAVMFTFAGSTLSVYAATRVAGVDNFSPALTDFHTGANGFYSVISMSQIGGSTIYATTNQAAQLFAEVNVPANKALEMIVYAAIPTTIAQPLLFYGASSAIEL